MHRRITQYQNRPQRLAVGDFNGDGKLDLASANYSGSVSVMLGNGEGTFGSATTYPPGGSIAVSDLNSDGKADLAVLDYPQLSILLGNGDGTFQPPPKALQGPGSFDRPRWCVRSCEYDVGGPRHVAAFPAG